MSEELERARAILKSESMMWIIAGSNHLESQLNHIRPVVREYWSRYGSWGKPPKKKDSNMTIESIRLQDCEEQNAPSTKLLEVVVVEDIAFLNFLEYTGQMHGGQDEYVVTATIALNVDVLKATLSLLEGS